MTRYLIDRVTLFDNETFELSCAADPAAMVLLGAAASRCLTALLEAQGTIVTKKELLYQGWERYGQQVSGNSVNQSVAQIRRCLVNLGQSPDWLVTVPRIGYKVADSLVIEKPDNERIEEALPVPVVADAPAMLDLPNAAGNNTSSRLWRVAGRVRYLFRRIRLLAYICAFLGLNTALAFSWEARRSASPLASEVPAPYAPVASHGPSHFFVGVTLTGKPEAWARHIHRLQGLPPGTMPLAERPYVYINGTLRDDVYSYFLCAAPIDHALAHCLSYLIIDERVE